MRIKTFLNKSIGIEVSVNMLKGGRYVVVVYDIEDMKYLPETEKFLDRTIAIQYAERRTNSSQATA